MNPEDDDFLKKYRGPGVSPAWQILAIIAGLSTFILFVIAVGLGTALAFERDRTRRSFAQPVLPWQPPPPPAPWNNNPDADEPPNAPYPLEADLRPPFPRPIPGEAPPMAKQETPHDRLVKLGREVWTPPDDATPMHLSISPDGKQIAFVANEQLHVGPLDGPAVQVGAGALGLGGGAAAGGFGPGGAGGPPGAMGFAAGEATIVGRPAWSADGRFIYFADSEGGLKKYDAGIGALEGLGFPGDCPVPVGETHLAFRRSRSKAKTDQNAPGDPAEIVLADLNTREVRVLIAEGHKTPEPFAASPDGKQLVVLVTKEQAPNLGEQHLELYDLEKKGPRRRLGPAGYGHDTVGWARDGRGLLLGLMPLTSPPDRWDFGSPLSNGTEVYHLNLATDKLTRLSRAGAVSDFAGVSDNDLYLLVLEQAAEHWVKKLRRVPLGELQKFAEAEPDREPREAKAWAELFQRVLDKVRLAPDADGKSVTPETLAQLADEFAAGYREQFKAEPPADIPGWERLTLELGHLSVPGRPRAGLVLGAAVGEYLRRKHGASWHLGAGPLVALLPNGPAAEELPFALEVNPFQTARQSFVSDPAENDDPYMPTLSLRDILVQAEGRTIILGNNPRELRKAAEATADSDLARAQELFAQKKPDEGQKLLLELVKQPKHTANEVLKLHVAKLLCENGRGKAAVRLLDPGKGALPPNPRLYNLLGLAVMETDPNASVPHFRNAMRCDLYFGPAYLNMAMAFEKAGDLGSSSLCLRRYLKLMSFGPYATDARQRLARLQDAMQAGAGAPGIPGPPGDAPAGAPGAAPDP